MNYPKREPFFAHKFVRLLTKSCAAQDIGLNAFALLCVIAHQEDSARYCGPVRFWNEQLMSTLSLSPRALRDARDKAVQFGWLVYSREHDRATGRYFVTIPEHFSGLSDAPIEEPCAVRGEASGEASGADLHKEMHKEVTSNCTRSEHETAPEPSPPSIPIPNPIPNPEITTAVAVVEAPEDPSRTAANHIIQAFTEATGFRAIATKKRIASVRERIRDPVWRDSWLTALEKACQIPALFGENDRGWKMDIEWFLRPDTVAKILEGKYDNWTRTKSDSAAERREQANVDAFTQLRLAISNQ
jgi:hypothetical protein